MFESSEPYGLHFLFSFRLRFPYFRLLLSPQNLISVRSKNARAIKTHIFPKAIEGCRRRHGSEFCFQSRCLRHLKLPCCDLHALGANTD
jgi:hypothetical protein